MWMARVSDFTDYNGPQKDTLYLLMQSWQYNMVDGSR